MISSKRVPVEIETPWRHFESWIKYILRIFRSDVYEWITFHTNTNPIFQFFYKRTCNKRCYKSWYWIVSWGNGFHVLSNVSIFHLCHLLVSIEDKSNQQTDGKKSYPIYGKTAWRFLAVRGITLSCWNIVPEVHWRMDITPEFLQPNRLLSSLPSSTLFLYLFLSCLSSLSFSLSFDICQLRPRSLLTFTISKCRSCKFEVVKWGLATMYSLF